MAAQTPQQAQLMGFALAQEQAEPGATLRLAVPDQNSKKAGSRVSGYHWQQASQKMESVEQAGKAQQRAGPRHVLSLKSNLGLRRPAAGGESANVEGNATDERKELEAYLNTRTSIKLPATGAEPGSSRAPKGQAKPYSFLASIGDPHAHLE